jgi:hypothetical protein
LKTAGTTDVFQTFLRENTHGPDSPDLVKFILGDTGVPFDWEYGDYRRNVLKLFVCIRAKDRWPQCTLHVAVANILAIR